MRSRCLILVRCVLLVMILATPLRAALPFIAFTADTEGKTSPCQTCPVKIARGGMDRRATALTQLRGTQQSVLLLDGGNFLYGADSTATGGKIMEQTYAALAYDAANVSWRDFREGKAHTLEVLKDAPFAVVSANLLDDATGQPLFKPYVVKQNVAIIGVSDIPAGMSFLPHLKEQLAGIRIVPVHDALADVIPKAKAEADSVVLLFYGTPKTLNSVRKDFGSKLDAICVGGLTPDQLPNDAAPPLVASEPQGKNIATLLGGSTVASIDLTPDVESDPKIAAMIAPPPPKFLTAAPTVPPTTPTTAPTLPPVVTLPHATPPTTPPSSSPPTTGPTESPVVITPPPRTNNRK